MLENIFVICQSKLQDEYAALLLSVKKITTIFTSEEVAIRHFAEQEADAPTYTVGIIQLDLHWNHQRFSGFQIAKKLRILGVQCPFLFRYGRNNFDPRLKQHALLRVKQYHQIITRPITPTFLADRSWTPMSEIKRKDMVNTLFNNRSLVNEILHELKNKIIAAANEQQFVAITKQLEQSFIAIKRAISSNHSTMEEIDQSLQVEIAPLLNPKESGKIPYLIDSYKHRILEAIPKEEELNLPPTVKAAQKVRWKVVYYEDDAALRTQVKDLLEDASISCEVFSDGRAVLETLKKDEKRKEIAVLLCDIRILEKENSTIWADYQGYDVMRAVRHQQKNILEFVVITSGRKRLIKLLENDDLKVHRRLKQDIFSSQGAKNMFVDDIRRWGNEIFFKTRSCPTLKSWVAQTPRFAAPLGRYYREHLMSVDYEMAERAINRTALEYIQFIKNQKTPPIIAFRGTMKTASPNSIFGLQKFRDNILTGRRIALALYYSLELTKEEVYAHMQPSSTNRDNPTDDDLRALFITMFALSFQKDLPQQKEIDNGNFLTSGLLEEEIIWLKDNFDFNFNLKINRLGKIDKDIISIFMEEWQEEFKRMPGINQLMTTDAKLKSLLNYSFDKIKKVSDVKTKLKDLVFYLKPTEKWSKFKNDLQSECEDVENQKLKDLLQSYLVED